MTKTLKLIFLSLFILSSSISLAQNKASKAYAEKYGELAVREMKRTGIPASITLAQGIIESGAGTTTLARLANNHFGVKAGKNWQGKRYKNFRSYDSVQEAYDDRSDFLSSRSQYAFLFRLDKCDYKAWARGLQRSGYARSKRYASDLIHCINANKLYKYDEAVCGEQTIEDVVSMNDPVAAAAEKSTKPHVHHAYYKVKKGDTLSGIAHKHGISVNKLKSLNSLRSTQLKPGQKIRVR
ncbi:glucosaminidase domain-containing protein [Solitalea koreensis]|uniref:Peptidoglycan hydrolase n=1 Tax=Solitalea koreensis TaxID=543615 RepID=A0A521AXM1_9SPHI|nr:glucosaminidase domain-containing protein [Solitalea koreensis]SMO39566.1 Flagellum-specific peptidoglycan hydrolase FlgJ [Solitalea koreensis]